MAVKACTSFRAAYEPMALEICETDTPGTAPIHLDRVHYKRLPHYFYPFTDISEYSIPPARIDADGAARRQMRKRRSELCIERVRARAGTGSR